MTTNEHNKLNGLDHLRAFAICFVFLFHYQILSKGEPEWLTAIAVYGWTGVDLFFVLSGFLISSQLFQPIARNEKPSFAIFFLKRFFRIIPAYVVVVGIYFLIPFFREKEALPPLWKFLTFTQNFGLNLREYGTFSHVWSLCVEEHFYILLPLFVFALAKTNRIKKGYWLLVIAIVLCIALRAFIFCNLYLPESSRQDNWMYWYKYIYYPTYTRLDALLIGVSIAAFHSFLSDKWKAIAKHGNVLLAIGLSVLAAAFYVCQDQFSYIASVWGFLLVALGYGLVTAAAISPSCFFYKWSSPVSSFIARLSYAIYLTHKGIIHVTRHWLATYNINDTLLFVLCIGTCISGALILNIAIERPFLKLKDKILASFVVKPSF